MNWGKKFFIILIFAASFSWSVVSGSTYKDLPEVGGGDDLSAVAEDIIPTADDTYDIGSAAASFKGLYLDGALYLDDTFYLAQSGNNLRLGSAFNSVEPSGTGTINLGNANRTFGELYLDDPTYGGGLFFKGNGTMGDIAGGTYTGIYSNGTNSIYIQAYNAASQYARMVLNYQYVDFYDVQSIRMVSGGEIGPGNGQFLSLGGTDGTSDINPVWRIYLGRDGTTGGILYWNGGTTAFTEMNDAGTELNFDGYNITEFGTGLVLEADHGVSSATNTARDDHIIGVDTTGGAVTITLDTDDVESGRALIVKDEGGNAGSANITIDTEGSETIDGAASVTISTNYGYRNLYSDGSNWFIMGSN